MDYEDIPLPQFHATALSQDQLAMLDLLGRPEIIGSHGTMRYYFRDLEPDGVSTIAQEHTVSYTCPVIMVAGKPRRVMPNGDLREVDMDDVNPVRGEWLD